MRNISRLSALSVSAIALAGIASGFTLLSADLHAEELAPLAGRSIVLGEMRLLSRQRHRI